MGGRKDLASKRQLSMIEETDDALDGIINGVTFGSNKSLNGNLYERSLHLNALKLGGKDEGLWGNLRFGVPTDENLNVEESLSGNSSFTETDAICPDVYENNQPVRDQNRIDASEDLCRGFRGRCKDLEKEEEEEGLENKTQGDDDDDDCDKDYLFHCQNMSSGSCQRDRLHTEKKVCASENNNNYYSRCPSFQSISTKMENNDRKLSDESGHVRTGGDESGVENLQEMFQVLIKSIDGTWTGTAERYKGIEADDNAKSTPLLYQSDERLEKQPLAVDNIISQFKEKFTLPNAKRQQPTRQKSRRNLEVDHLHSKNELAKEDIKEKKTIDTDTNANTDFTKGWGTTSSHGEGNDDFDGNAVADSEKRFTDDKDNESKNFDSAENRFVRVFIQPEEKANDVIEIGPPIGIDSQSSNVIADRLTKIQTTSIPLITRDAPEDDYMYHFNDSDITAKNNGLGMSTEHQSNSGKAVSGCALLQVPGNTSTSAPPNTSTSSTTTSKTLLPIPTPNTKIPFLNANGSISKPILTRHVSQPNMGIHNNQQNLANALNPQDQNATKDNKLCNKDLNSDLAKLKATAIRLNLTTRRPSYLQWLEDRKQNLPLSKFTIRKHSKDAACSQTQKSSKDPSSFSSCLSSTSSYSDNMGDSVNKESNGCDDDDDDYNEDDGDEDGEIEGCSKGRSLWSGKSRSADGLLSSQRKQNIEDSLEWLRQELQSMRGQDQSLARQLLTLRHDIHKVRLSWSCQEHQELLDEVHCDLEDLHELPNVLDLPRTFYLDTPLKNVGVTRLNISARRFSTC